MVAVWFFQPLGCNKIYNSALVSQRLCERKTDGLFYERLVFATLLLVVRNKFFYFVLLMITLQVSSKLLRVGF